MRIALQGERSGLLSGHVGLRGIRGAWIPRHLLCVFTMWWTVCFQGYLRKQDRRPSATSALNLKRLASNCQRRDGCAKYKRVPCNWQSELCFFRNVMSLWLPSACQPGQPFELFSAFSMEIMIRMAQHSKYWMCVGASRSNICESVWGLRGRS